MGPGEHRPYDKEYWTRPWSTGLFAGDLFEAVPFGDQPTVIYTAEEGDEAGKHFVGEISLGYGLLITPTCDMSDQHGQAETSHPFRTLVPVVPLALVIEQTGSLEKSADLLRSRDAIHPYMYLPALGGVFADDAVACLFRPTLVSDDFLATPPRRIAQLQPPGRRHLKVKLAAYWGRVLVDPDELPHEERGEEELQADAWPPSRYDDASGPVVGR